MEKEYKENKYDLYNIIRKARNCIVNYLIKFGVIVETYEKIQEFGEIKGLIELSKKDYKIGTLKYYFYKPELFIEKIEILDTDVKNIIPIKLSKVFFLHLLAIYIDRGAKYFKLIADPYAFDDYKGKGKESSLGCYYEKLGFKVSDKDDIKSFIKLCLDKIKNDKNLSPMCYLKECQKIFVYTKFEIMKVKMNALIPHLINELKITLKDMKCIK